jgi:GT2 family glycosyltransferase
MSQPLVSVAMVVCNVDRFLGEAIESILGQTFREFEFIIVDFGSTDNSKSIISKYAASDSRIRFQEIPHCGLAEARNAACALSRGRYIAIMDADDVALPERLRWQVEFMESRPETGVLGGAVECINPAGRALVTWSDPTEHYEIMRALDERCPLRQPAVLMRRDAFASIGGYRAPFAPAEDYDLWLRIAEHYQIANLEQVVLKYRIHPHQVSLRKPTQQVLGMLAARASASLRRRGLPDALGSLSEITPEVLSALGITVAEQQRELALHRWQWIQNMYAAGEYSDALNAALGILGSDRNGAERWQIAQLHLIVARLYWKQNHRLKSGLSVAHAVLMHPEMMGRPLKPLLRRIGLV